MTATTRKPSKEEIESVASVLRDPSRHDRFLRRDREGRLYTTPDVRFIGPAGPMPQDPYIKIPGDYKLTRRAATAWAKSLARELDDIAKTWTY